MRRSKRRCRMMRCRIRRSRRRRRSRRAGAEEERYLEPVPPVPVPALLQHLLGLGDVGGGDGVVAVEQPDPDVEEHQVHPVAEPDRLLGGLPHRLHRRVLVTYTREELGPVEEKMEEIRGG
jgi:hypothetical protein